jgi:hypothetical protein
MQVDDSGAIRLDQLINRGVLGAHHGPRFRQPRQTKIEVETSTVAVTWDEQILEALQKNMARSVMVGSSCR